MTRTAPLLALTLALALSACAPGTTTYAYRANTAPAQADRDSFQCQVEATRTIPVNTQVRQRPGYWIPPRTICDRDGKNCYVEPSEWIPGEVYSYDANAGLRTEYIRRCLAGRGYTLTAVDLCPGGTTAEGPLAQALLSRLRPVRDGACAINISERSSNLIYAEERG
jgi:hypothetical protein